MSFQNNVFRPGVILHEVIVGALRTNGETFNNWFKNNGMSVTGGRNRNACHGAVSRVESRT